MEDIHKIFSQFKEEFPEIHFVSCPLRVVSCASNFYNGRRTTHHGRFV